MKNKTTQIFLILISLFTLVSLLNLFLILFDNNRNDDISTENNNPESNSYDKYELTTAIIYDQLFLGTWVLKEVIPLYFIPPSSHDRRNPDYDAILGTEVTFGTTSTLISDDPLQTVRVDYIEYNGERHELLHGYRTYTFPIFSEDERIGYYRASDLGITGEYYSMVHFVQHDNYRYTNAYLDETRYKQIHMQDLCFLYLRDYNTIYASSGVLAYLLERVEPHPDAQPSTALTPDTNLINNIGKTPNQLISEDPALVFGDLGFGPAAAQGLGTKKSGGDYLYEFFYSQEIAPLEEMVSEYGDILICYGVVATVGDIFTETADNMPLDEFFETIGVSEYDYTPDGEGAWFDKTFINFTCKNGLFYTINAYPNGFDPETYEAITHMNHGYQIRVLNTELRDSRDNAAKIYDFMNELS
ncbi:MAG: hypothetical protein FWH20_06760 [Oscillospiraceae bacterium]|nr:hypothetical protein [Oscillospiraceae bacterium]